MFFTKFYSDKRVDYTLVVLFCYKNLTMQVILFILSATVENYDEQIVNTKILLRPSFYNLIIIRMFIFCLYIAYLVASFQCVGFFLLNISNYRTQV